MERLTERWGENNVWVKEHDYISAAYRLAAYERRYGNVFRIGYDVFADLVENGRIKPVSEEAKKALRRAENG